MEHFLCQDLDKKGMMKVKGAERERLQDKVRVTMAKSAPVYVVNTLPLFLSNKTQIAPWNTRVPS